MTTAEVGDHVERFREIYRLSLTDPASSGVYDALVRHFNDYALEFMSRSSGPEIPDASRRVIAQFRPMVSPAPSRHGSTTLR
ncbi:hypothetical protein [Streptomyces sp. NPDC058255]|uniref:hypothetical protein n=1 Tax=Streptomyces sp. NPDC058255 TaxID=3346407 RepID=UPI0036E723A0